MISPKKILAIKLRSLGDTVLMTAAVDELIRAFPQAELHLVVQSPWTPILEKHKGVTHIWTYDRHPDAASRAKAVARLGLKLRKERYDCVLNFHASPSSSTLAFATGAKVRAVHFHGHKDKDRFGTVPIPGKGTLFPVIERDLNVIRALGVQVPEGRLPRIQLDHIEIDRGIDLVEGRGLSGSLLTIGVGSSRPTKSWPIERYAEVAKAWCEKTGGSVLAVGSADEEPLCRDFLNAAGEHPKIQAEWNFDVRTLASVLKSATLMLGNDSGPRHIAVAVGTPTLTLFGPEHPFEWHPYPTDKHPYLYIDNLACRRDATPGMPAWCSLHECVVEKHKCMQDLTASAVLEECLKLAGQ